MTRRLATAVLLGVSIAWTGPAVAERLVTSISRHQVMVTSNFSGTSIVLFGTVEPDTPNARRRAGAYDLVVTVTGPKETIVERRKERMLGIWTNMASRTFVNVPSYLAVLSNQPFNQITDAETVRRLAAVLDVRYRQLESGDFNHTSALLLLDGAGRILARTDRLSSTPDPQFITALRAALAAP